MMLLSMPASPNFRRISFNLRGNTQAFGESWSRSLMTKGLDGVRWAATFELPPMKRADAAAWCAFLARCGGRAGRFFAGDAAGATPRGTGAGTPTITIGDQTGYSLHVGGWTPGSPPLFRGDYIAWNTPTGWREMHKLTADANTVGSVVYGTGAYGAGVYGAFETVISIIPAIRESPTIGTPIIIQAGGTAYGSGTYGSGVYGGFTGPYCIMRLVDDDQGGWDVDYTMFYGLKFAAEEVWS